MEKTAIYDLAGYRVKIGYLYDHFREFASGYELEGAEFDEEIQVTPEDIEFEAEKSRNENLAEGIPVIDYPPEYLETLAVYRKACDKLVMRDVLLFHSSAIAVDGKAYLFTAPSGTGKSTHVRLWRKVYGDRVMMINDDKPLLSISPDGAIAHGTPWDGKHHRSNHVSVPIGGICLLGRGEKNRIRRISGVEALPTLMSQTYRPSGAPQIQKTMELVLQMAKTVPLWKMECNMDPEAAITAYEAMSQV